MRHQVGFVDGAHYTQHVEKVKDLKRSGSYDEAVDLLLRLVNATEEEAAAEGFGVAPWYYEQLAIIYRKHGGTDSEIAILERYAEQPHGRFPMSPKLAERLTRLKNTG